MIDLAEGVQVWAQVAKRLVAPKAVINEPALLRLANRLEPAMRQRFLQTLAAYKSRINFNDLAEALLQGNLSGVDALLQLDLLGRLFQERIPLVLRQAFMQAGTITVQGLEQTIGTRMDFTAVSPTAVQYLRTESSARITRISESTRAGIRFTLADAVQHGTDVRTIGRQLRGMIGLNEPQLRAVGALREALEAQGLGAVAIEQKIIKYSQSLLRLRAEMIARSEVLDAIHAAQQAGWEEAISQEQLDPNRTHRKWIATFDGRADATCEALHGQVVPWGSLFVGPDGETYERPPIHPMCRCTLGLVFKRAKQYALGEGAGGFVLEKSQAHCPAGSSSGGEFTGPNAGNCGAGDGGASEGFASVAAAHEWGLGQSRKVKLGADEQAVLKGYKNMLYSPVNGYLRNGTAGVGAETDKKMKQYVRTLDGALKKATIDRNVTVFRAAEIPDLAKNPDKWVGKTIDSPSYLSTSLDQGLVQRKYLTKNAVGFELKLSAGAKALYLEGLSGWSAEAGTGEAELMLPRGAKIRITGSRKAKGKTWLQGEVVS